MEINCKVKAIESALCGEHNSTETITFTDEEMKDISVDPFQYSINISSNYPTREEFSTLTKRPADTNRVDDLRTLTEDYPDTTLHHGILMKDVKDLRDPKIE